MNKTKPLSLLRQEYIDNLLELTNNAGLPMFCIEDILKNFIELVKTASATQYQKDKQEYENNKENEEKNNA